MRVEFSGIKEATTMAAVLILPDETGTFVIYSDSSHKGLGCVLMQYRKVIVYAVSYTHLRAPRDRG